jgi:hypothetical protein
MVLLDTSRPASISCGICMGWSHALAEWPLTTSVEMWRNFVITLAMMKAVKTMVLYLTWSFLIRDWPTLYYARKDGTDHSNACCSKLQQFWHPTLDSICWSPIGLLELLAWSGSMILI